MHTFVPTLTEFRDRSIYWSKCELTNLGTRALEPFKFRTAEDFVMLIAVCWLHFKEEECRKNGKPYIGAFSFNERSPLYDIRIPEIEKYRIMELDVSVGDRTLTYLLRTLLPVVFKELVRRNYLTLNKNRDFVVVHSVSSLYYSDKFRTFLL